MSFHQYLSMKWQLALFEAKIAGVVIVTVVCGYLIYRLYKLVRRG